ncbi:MAG: histidine-type phosphatase [bacterium]|nr:histidine-type phosphatase [bacterium]
MQKLVLKFLILIFLFQLTLSASEKLIFASVLFRHGDRTPTKALKNKNNIHQWKIGLGELTPKGMRQEYDLGSYLRERYIKKFKLIPENYNSNLIYIRSTDINRTLMSAESLLYGFYPPGSGPLLSDKKSALQYRYQPVPVHSVLEMNDKLLSAQSIYKPKIHKLQKKLVYDTNAWKKMQVLYQCYFEKWSKISGFKIDKLKDVNFFAANIFIRNIHGIKQPEGITAVDEKNLIELYPWIHAEQYKPQVIGMLISKDFICQIIKDLKRATKKEKEFKLVFYSAHDTNILGLMSALGVSLGENPPYASFIAIELFKFKNEYFIKLKYNKKDVELPIENKNNYYPLNAFINYCNNLQ